MTIVYKVAGSEMDVILSGHMLGDAWPLIIPYLFTTHKISSTHTHAHTHTLTGPCPLWNINEMSYGQV